MLPLLNVHAWWQVYKDIQLVVLTAALHSKHEVYIYYFDAVVSTDC